MLKVCVLCTIPTSKRTDDAEETEVTFSACQTKLAEQGFICIKAVLHKFVEAQSRNFQDIAEKLKHFLSSTIVDILLFVGEHGSKNPWSSPGNLLCNMSLNLLSHHSWSPTWLEHITQKL